jgi:ParB-like nuclease domain
MAEQHRRERWKLDDLRPAPYNPRRISKPALDGLMDSISRFGQVQDIIVNERSGFVIGGHQRVEAMKRLGHTECDVLIVDLDDTQERALNLALNNPHIAGEFDETLGALLQEIRSADPDAFTELRFEALIPRETAKAEPEDEKPERIEFLIFAHQQKVIEGAMERLRRDIGPVQGKRGEKIRNGEILTELCRSYLDVAD